jgi:hypothetical protein
MEPTPDDFGDPVLKTAVQRAWGCECCPLQLRKRLEGAIGGAKGSGLRFMPRGWFIGPLAAAAMVVLVIGGWRMMHTSTPADFPSTLAADLIYRHDSCCKKPDHQGLPVPKTDDTAIAAAMESRLSRAVLMARPQDPGWTFRGAAICHVGKTESGHLVFLKGDDAISVFSLPSTLDPTLHDGQHVELTSNNHPIIAFAKDGALFCLVGSGSVDEDQLDKMRQYMDAQVTTAAISHEPRTTVSELIYPVDH